MTKANKARLHELEAIKLRLKHPTFPEHCIPYTVWSDTSANALTKCVTEFINMSGYQAERISTQGTYIEGKKLKVADITRPSAGKYIPTQGTKGSADISSTIHGRSVKIEIKQKDKQSEHQKAYQLSIEKAGGVYIIVRTFDEFIIWYDNFVASLK